MHETIILHENSFKLFKYIIRMLYPAILNRIGYIGAAYDSNENHGIWKPFGSETLDI